MAQWGNTDDAANSVLWAAAQLNLVANTDNQTNLFGNTTGDAFITGATIGQFGVDTTEAQAARAGANTKAAHAGWVLRTEGSGNRAGRVHNEVLVAMGSISSDASDDAVIPDYLITITGQPEAASANSSDDEQGVFTVTAITSPTGGTLTYQWQGNSSGSFANLSNGSGVAGATSDELTLDANTVTQQHVRVLVLETGSATKTSDAVLFTVTS